MSSICCILNYPSHYRYAIYKLMAERLNCDFYFGNIEDGRLKKFDFSLFPKEITQLQTKKIFLFNWIQGSVQLVFHPYKKYVLTGDIRCLSDWVILIFNRLRGKKTYLWTHGWYGDETTGKKIVKKIFLGLSHGLFLYGNYAKELMIKEGYNKNRLHVIYNSLSYDLQLNVRRKLKQSDISKQYFKETVPVIIFTGRLTKVKKIELLINAHRILVKQGIHVNVFLLGDGDIINSLKQNIENLGLSDFYYFYGECYDENIIGNLYYNSTVCVSPGNVGLTAIHAMMYGCPVISHSDFTKQMPEFEVIEKGKTGDFFDFDNVESLANTIKLWVENNYPKPIELVENCFKVIDSQFNPDYQIKIFEKVLT